MVSAAAGPPWSEGGIASSAARHRFWMRSSAGAVHHLVVGDADDVDLDVAQLVVADAVGLGVVLGAVELDRELVRWMAEQEVAPPCAGAVCEAGRLEERVERCLRREPMACLGSNRLRHPLLQEHRLGVAVDEHVGVARCAVERRVEGERALREGLRQDRARLGGASVGQVLAVPADLVRVLAECGDLADQPCGFERRVLDPERRERRPPSAEDLDEQAAREPGVRRAFERARGARQHERLAQHLAQAVCLREVAVEDARERADRDVLRGEAWSGRGVFAPLDREVEGPPVRRCPGRAARGALLGGLRAGALEPAGRLSSWVAMLGGCHSRAGCAGVSHEIPRSGSL